MRTELLFFQILAISATITHALPQVNVPSHSTSHHHSSSHHISYKTSTPTTKASKSSPGKHNAAAPDPTSASSASARSAIYAADAAMMANGPPTTLDAAQIQVSKQLAEISADGARLHAAGTASTASVASASTAAATAPVDCNDGSWALTMNNYNNASTDKNLQTWWFGGKDTDGNTFPGLSTYTLRCLQ